MSIFTKIQASNKKKNICKKKKIEIESEKNYYVES